MKEFKKLLMWFGFFFIVKAVLSYFIPSPSIFGDEYVYAKLARSLFFNLEFTVHNIPINHYPPLYPFLLSFAYLFKDMTLVYSAMKIIGAFVSSLIIFPAYYLAREFLSRKRSLFISIFVSFLAISFNFSSYILAENLFYPLVLTTIYFMFKAFKENKTSYFAISGLFLGLSFLTRFIAIALIPIVLLTYFYFYKKVKINFWNIFTHYFISLVIVLPWIIRNFLIYGVKVSSIIGRGAGLSGDLTPLMQLAFYFNSIIIYLGYALLASLVFFGIYFLYGYKIKDINFKILFLITLLATLLLTFLGANRLTGAGAFHGATTLLDLTKERPLGRYIETILPSIMILGFIVYNKFIVDRKVLMKITIFSSLILAFASQLTLNSLFPVNNQSLTFLGVSQYVLEFLLLSKTAVEPMFNLTSFLIIIISLILLPFIIYLLMDKKNFVYFLLAFVIFNSLLSFGATYWNSDTYWLDGPQMQLGIAYNEVEDRNLKEVILFDDRFEGKNRKTDQLNLYEVSPNKFKSTTTMAGFWMNDEIRIGDVSNLDGINYVVTKEEMDLNLIKEESGIYLYGVER